jgi:FtsP/CotA-like multicopper oxidase with cupredoxin domain
MKTSQLHSAFVAACLACSLSCGTTPEAPPPAQEDPLALTTLEDLNADPNILEVNLEAREADKQFGTIPVSKVWTYNGTVPGPLLDVKVGDRLIVHFTNRLPEATTVHWHGIRLPAAMDGSLAMQAPIEPGGTFRYEFVLKDAGLFWFHPHMRTDVQIEKGLAGVIRVRGTEEPQADEERVLVLDDVRLKEDGSFPTYLDDASKMMGREGNTILVNGVTNATIPVTPGAAVRWRIVNVGNGRFFNLKLPGVNWWVIGTDGGLLPKPYQTDRLLIAPAERYDVMFIAPKTPNTEGELTSEAYERGHHSGERSPITVAKVRTRDVAAVQAKSLPTSFRDLVRLPDGLVDMPITLDEGSNDKGEMIFTVNGALYPNVAPFIVKNGATRVLEVKNASDMDHPFHLHGFFFQLLATNGVPTPSDRLANKDTIIVPGKTTLRLASHFDEPGMWMYHCHINEHAEGGMMGEIHVE